MLGKLSVFISKELEKSRKEKEDALNKVKMEAWRKQTQEENMRLLR